MPVIEEMPSGVEAAWKERRNGSGDLPLTVAVKADIGPDGAVGERWVVADGSAVRVFTSDGNGQARVDLDLPLEKITDFRTEHLVGGGSLLAERGTDLV